MKSIPIPRFLAKLLLWLTQFFNDNSLILVCKGYDEDDENYTGLYWDEDKDADLKDSAYFDFKLWINAKPQ